MVSQGLEVYICPMYMILGKEVCAGPMLMISQTGGVYMYLSHVNDMRWIPVSNDISVWSCIPVLC